MKLIKCYVSVEHERCSYDLPSIQSLKMHEIALQLNFRATTLISENDFPHAVQMKEVEKSHLIS